MQILRFLLFPFSLIYGLFVFLRNVLYNRGILKATKAPLFTIVVGNIHMGGTGKTPHTIWLSKELQDLQPAILSRGYGRKSKGFLKVKATMSPSQSGDEPLSYAKRFPELNVAVAEDRLSGISALHASGQTGPVILDDAFQHRRLEGDLNLCLIHSDSDISKEWHFPTGNLRDSKLRLKDADAILFTSCPSEKEEEKKNQIKGLIHKDTPIFFSDIHYNRIEGLSDGSDVIVVSAIANNDVFLKHAESRYNVKASFQYRDHHAFTEGDIEQWKTALAENQGTVLLTTEKDHNRMEGSAKALPVFVATIDIQLRKGEELIRLIRNEIQKKG